MGCSRVCSGYPQLGAQWLWATPNEGKGLWGITFERFLLQYNPAAAEVGQLLLQRHDVFFA